MKYLILVSHGGFAEGLKTSLAMFAEDKIDHVIAVGLKNGSSVDDFAKDFHQAVDHLTTDDQVVVLADIVGGSPLTTALGVLEEKELLQTATVLGGMNLPMAVTSVVMKDSLEGDDFVAAVLPEAQTALQEFKVATTSTNDEEDDDI
ncbi:PTS sugar transporter subunit IIA [Streptococcus jiangjianxini]|uniref:PTS sugar transporter subunit IIA n=1 Tax=Streptococcus jiangjianxini TaxID=3161189 RepID=UPI0032EC34A1